MSSNGGNQSSSSSASSGHGGQADDAGEDEDSSSSSEHLKQVENEISRPVSREGTSSSSSASAAYALDAEDDIGSDAANTNTGIKPDPDTENQARELFLQGVKYEQDGQLFDAILKYKKAVHLVPDIEFKTFNFTQNRSVENVNRNTPEKRSKGDGEEEKEEDDEADMEVDSTTDLISRFYRLSINSAMCVPEENPKTTHISRLPLEVLITILKWVVSSDLDLTSLERCSEVCRGFYLAARSQDIWRPICLRTWGLDSVPPDIKQMRSKGDASSWRQYYLTRPRVQLQGCYIARMSYLRQGERGFQDNEFYRSWHVVQYYRLIRFFAGGRLAMVTTAEEPSIAVKGLQSRHSSLLQGVMFGSYRTDGNRLICLVHKNPDKVFDQNSNINRGKRRKAGPPAYVFEVPEQDFHFELELSGRRHQRLQWKSYIVISRYRSGASAEQVSEFDVSNINTFPQLHFSPVKSYNTETLAPLI